MKVLLLKDLKGKGKAGDVVDVNDGYAKNFLIPKKFATEATKQILSELEQKRQKEARIKEEEYQNAVEFTKKLNGFAIDIKVKTNQEKLHGSVTTIDIAKALQDAGFELDKRAIQLKSPIKTLGPHTVDIKTYANMSAVITVNVIAE